MLKKCACPPKARNQGKEDITQMKEPENTNYPVQRLECKERNLMTVIFKNEINNTRLWSLSTG